MRGAAEAAGRDPSAIEVTASSFITGDGEAVADVAELVELGVDRVVVPAALFAGDTPAALTHYRNHVIDRL